MLCELVHTSSYMYLCWYGLWSSRLATEHCAHVNTHTCFIIVSSVTDHSCSHKAVVCVCVCVCVLACAYIYTCMCIGFYIHVG